MCVLCVHPPTFWFGCTRGYQVHAMFNKEPCYIRIYYAGICIWHAPKRTCIQGDPRLARLK